MEMTEIRERRSEFMVKMYQIIAALSNFLVR